MFNIQLNNHLSIPGASTYSHLNQESPDVKMSSMGFDAHGLSPDPETYLMFGKADEIYRQEEGATELNQDLLNQEGVINQYLIPQLYQTKHIHFSSRD